MEVDGGDLRHEFKLNKLSQYSNCRDRIYMSGFYTKDGLFLNKDSEWQRYFTKSRMMKSGTILNMVTSMPVSWVHNDD